MTFIVHGHPQSPYVRAVVLTLAEKGKAATIHPIGAAGLKAEPHLSLHPFGKIPVLQHDGFTLYETQAILRHLDRLLPTPKLTPEKLREAARMDQVMGITDQYLMEGVNRVISYERIVKPMLMGLPPDLDAIKRAMPRARVVFAVLDAMLDSQAHFAGDALSLADLMVLPHIDMLAATPEWAELSAPNQRLVAWLARMKARPAMRREPRVADPQQA
jgi:glutathione S-transferase